MSWVQQSSLPLQQQQLKQQTQSQLQGQGQPLRRQMQQKSQQPPPHANAFFDIPTAFSTATVNSSMNSHNRPEVYAPFMASQPLTSSPQTHLTQHHLQQPQQHTQDYFSGQKQQQQLQHWQQQNYLQQSNPTQASANNWEQPQSQAQAQQPQHPTGILANMYPQHVIPSANASNNWSQQSDPQVGPVASIPANNYENLYTHNQSHMQEQHNQKHTQQSVVQYQQQQQLPQTLSQQQGQVHAQSELQAQAVNPQDFFENNNDNKNEGWGDWDWCDNNSTYKGNDLQPQSQSQPQAQTQTQPQLQPQGLQQHKQPQLLEQHQLQEMQQHQYKDNVVENSFNNDNWSWNVAEDMNANMNDHHAPTTSATNPEKTSAILYSTPQVPTAKDQQQISNNFQVPQKSQLEQQQRQQQQQQQQPQQQLIGATINNDNVMTLPSIESSNENYHISGPAPLTQNNNIPSSVYVSQAKPVSKPSRQYASPPVGITSSETLDSTLTPPQAFQNESQVLLAPTEGIATETLCTVAKVQPPPPPAATPPTRGPPLAAADDGTGAANPFKRPGAAQHHRGVLMPTSRSALNAAPMMLSSTLNMPPPPADFANPIVNTNSSALQPVHENQDVGIPTTILQTIPMPVETQSPALPPPNDERNQYLQTSHLSENPDEELNLEGDNNLPPPGLSRLVLGQPEVEASQRLVTGTEQPIAPTTHMHMEERQADGEDTSFEQLVPGALTNPPNRSLSNTQAVGATSAISSNMNYTTDRNLYLVPGESNASNEQRVVPGVETLQENVMANATTPMQIISEQREIELDGENLEDQQPIVVAASRDEPPLEGAVSGAELTVTSMPAESFDMQHSATKVKDLSNASTGNDESDPHQDNHHINKYANNKARKHADTEKKSQKARRGEKQRSVDRFESEEEESEVYSSDRERNRRRGVYREDNNRSEREDRGDREYREKRTRPEKRDSGGEREKNGRDKYYARGSNQGSKSERRPQRYPRYEDEVEESLRNKEQKGRRNGRGERGEREDRGGRSDRSDRDYDEYHYQRGHRYRGSRRGEKAIEERRGTYAVEEERRDERRHRRERDDYDTIERRRREKHNARGVDPREYDEYRKQSSRNARDSDLEKDRARGPDSRFDPRLAAMYGYPPAAYSYDPYAYYYEQMARTNPQAYAEWYKKYYGQTAALASHQHSGEHMSGGGGSLGATDGRESVHSGRSSAHNEKDRYTQAYISQANEYHHHFQFLHHQHQQQYQQQQQQQLQRQQLAMQNHMSLNSTMLEDTGSVYGGRLRAARSASNLSQAHSSTAPVGGAFYAAAANSGRVAYGYARSEYADSRSGNISLPDAVADPQRLTPCKFVNEHAVVSMGPGIVVTVKPKYTQHGCISNIVKLQRLCANDASRQLYQAYPGPLVRGLTHKKTIIEFCEEQKRLGPTQTTVYAKQLVSNNVDKYKASYTLMWNLLILLLRQNGMVVGVDIAELLLKNEQQFPYSAAQRTHTHASNSKSDNDTPAESEADEKLSDADAEDELEKEQSISAKSEEKSTSSHTPTELEITDKFRNYLLYGNVNEALDWATDNNLWGHALFLASKLDRRSHANVMMKFANKLSLNDPLQTLYQLMSGRTPSSVTSVQDEKWGDWRPHLSMILSNTSQKPELDRKAVTSLGDSLFNRGDVFAAHFCYLMAQVGFGRYQDSATQETAVQQNLPKLVLLGSSHYKEFLDFANDEAIMMTEIYEYACSLNDDKFCVIEFQPYKYLLAVRLLDYGYNLRSLMYMEQIALHIERDPSKFESSFIQKIYEFADRLKYCDPALEKTVDDQLQNSDDNNLNETLQNFEEQKWLQNLRVIAAQQQIEHKTSLYSSDNAVKNLQTEIDQQFTEINKQFNELNLQYIINDADTMQQQQPLQVPSPKTDAEIVNHYNQQVQIPTTNYEEQQHYSLPAQTSEAVNAVDPYVNYTQHYLQPNQAQKQQQHSYYEQQHQYNANMVEGNDITNVAAANAANAASNSYDYWAMQQQYGEDEPKPKSSIETEFEENSKVNNNKIATTKKPNGPLATRNFKTNLDKSKLQTQQNQQLNNNHNNIGVENMKAPKSLDRSKSEIKTTTTPRKSQNEQVEETARPTHFQQPQQPQNYPHQQQQQHQHQFSTPFLANENSRPTISMPKSKNYDSEDEAKRAQSLKQNSAGSQDNKGAQQQKQRSKNDTKDINKSLQIANQNSGWFGGIWNKLSLKPKNQMILPDDKNPTIVWDSEKKRWVNTDGEETADDSLKPPPKMSDIMPQPPAQLQPQLQSQLPPQPQTLQPPQAAQQSPLMDTPQYGGGMSVASPAAAMPTAPVQTQGYRAAAAAPIVGQVPSGDFSTQPKTPSLQSNMFKMQRNRTLKNSYVDVFNPSGAPMSKAAENILAPAVPSAAVPQGSYFIPGAPAPVSNDATAYQSPQQQDVPQFYNPNQYAAGGADY